MDWMVRFQCKSTRRKRIYEENLLLGKRVGEYKYIFYIYPFSVPLLRCKDVSCSGFCVIEESSRISVIYQCLKCNNVYFDEWKKVEVGFFCECGKLLWFKHNVYKLGVYLHKIICWNLYEYYFNG